MKYKKINQAFIFMATHSKLTVGIW
jgi:hypothetical protein